MIVIAAPTFAATDFVQDRLKVEWRNWLTTEMLNAYYAKRSYYHIHQKSDDLDNPDQVRLWKSRLGTFVPKLIVALLLLHTILSFFAH